MALGLIVLMAACGTDDSGTQDDPAGTADVAAAEELMAPFVGQASDFPASEPLQKSPAGKRAAFMECGTPTCGLYYNLMNEAAKTAGVTLVRVKTGQAADTVAAGFDAVLAGDYDGVIVPSITPALWQAPLAKLKAEGIPVVTVGVTEGDASKIDVMLSTTPSITRGGELLAAWAVAEGHHQPTIYITPEIPFTTTMADAFTEKLASLCPSCEPRTVKIPVATFGTRAPSVVVDDVQAHPDTDALVFTAGEQLNGLPAAMKTAGLDKPMIANTPGPENLQQIKHGELDQALGRDLPVIAWTAVDSLIRLMTGQEPDANVAADNPPMQFLGKDDLPADLESAWTGYPDYSKRFAALWKVSS